MSEGEPESTKDGQLRKEALEAVQEDARRQVRHAFCRQQDRRVVLRKAVLDQPLQHMNICLSC